MPTLEDKGVPLPFQTVPRGNPPESPGLDGSRHLSRDFLTRSSSELKWEGTVFRAFCPVLLSSRKLLVETQE